MSPMAEVSFFMPITTMPAINLSRNAIFVYILTCAEVSNGNTQSRLLLLTIRYATFLKATASFNSSLFGQFANKDLRPQGLQL